MIKISIYVVAVAVAAANGSKQHVNNLKEPINHLRSSLLTLPQHLKRYATSSQLLSHIIGSRRSIRPVQRPHANAGTSLTKFETRHLVNPSNYSRYNIRTTYVRSRYEFNLTSPPIGSMTHLNNETYAFVLTICIGWGDLG
ncbi:hypothetical protein F4814DRAFT_407690 [Daldinia grandis]|nr:hypothetical protein F4814DRAFT_407690 [Daldinia grandis]